MTRFHTDGKGKLFFSLFFKKENKQKYINVLVDFHFPFTFNTTAKEKLLWEIKCLCCVAYVIAHFVMIKSALTPENKMKVALKYINERNNYNCQCNISLQSDWFSFFIISFYAHFKMHFNATSPNCSEALPENHHRVPDFHLIDLTSSSRW